MRYNIGVFVRIQGIETEVSKFGATAIFLIIMIGSISVKVSLKPNIFGLIDLEYLKNHYLSCNIINLTIKITLFL